MKRSILTIILLSTLIYSCKKDEHPTHTNKPTTVSFEFSDFRSELTPFAKQNVKVSESDSLSKHATHLYYHVFKSTGEFVKTLAQQSGATGFGVIHDKLEPGSYVIFFTASAGGLNFTNTHDFYNIYMAPVSGNWKDLFMKKLNIVIESTPLNESITLDRIIGGLEVEFQSAIPPSTAYVYVYTSDVTHYRMNKPEVSAPEEQHEIQYGIKRTFAISSQDIGKNMKFFIYTFTRPDLFWYGIRQNVWLEAVSVDKKRLGYASMQITTEKNKISTVYGNPFWGAATDFEVTINRTWGTPTVIPFN